MRLVSTIIAACDLTALRVVMGTSGALICAALQVSACRSSNPEPTVLGPGRSGPVASMGDGGPAVREDGAISQVVQSDAGRRSDAGSEAGCGDKTEYGDLICCGKADELPGLSCIDLTDGGTVFGTFGRCLVQGERFDARQVGSVCCDGLRRLDSDQPVEVADGGESRCEPELLPLKYCSACGNEVCDTVENRCNCPQDCK
jgi:hypothetical protein